MADRAEPHVEERRHEGGEEFLERVRPHLGALRRLLYTLLNGNRADMEDLEQEVLLDLYRSLPRFRGQCSPKTWLLRIGRNKAVDHLRRRGAERRALRRLAGPSAAEEAVDPEADLIRGEQARELWAAFERLPPAERLLIQLREVEDLSVEETARVCGLPAGTVKSRLHRSRRRLMRLIEEEGR